MNSNESLANALRRSISEVPTLAIDEVEFFKNDSALYDEYLAHRIGLVPLKMDKKMGKGDVEFKLVKKGPCTVYAGDLKGSVEVVHPGIPLVLLEKDQELELVATARVGQGTEHAKHIPGTSYYRHLFEVKAKDKRMETMILQSKGLIRPEKIKDVWLCDLNEAIVHEIESEDASALKQSDQIVIVIESYGSMSAQDILMNASGALGENLDELEKALK
jgi:DNA-directed RNA polymerase subunit D